MIRRPIFLLFAALFSGLFFAAPYAHAAQGCDASDNAKHLNLINSVRLKNRLQPFRMNPQLSQLARKVADEYTRTGDQTALVPEDLERLGYNDPNMLSQIIFSSPNLSDDYKELNEATTAITQNETTDIGMNCFTMEGYYPTRVVLQARKVTDLTENDVPQCQNGFAERVMDITNEYRRSYGLGEVRWNVQLAAAAREQADYMVKIDRMQHEGANNSKVGERATAHGYRYYMVSENVASGQDTPEEVMEGWKKSPGHNKNLLEPEAEEIGVACANPRNGTGKALGKHHVITWAQVFGKQR